MNPFSKHGIEHLSPSSLNLYGANQCLWCLRYLHKVKDDFGPAAKRGNAIEAGLDAWLFGRKGDEALARARDEFTTLTLGVIDAEHDAERANVDTMLMQAMDATKDLPTPVARQMRVEYYANGVEVPIIGFADYSFEGFDLDLKTTKALPSSIKPEHGRQVSVYGAARKKPQKLLYVTGKKHATYDLTDNEAAAHLRDIDRLANSIRHMLAKADDAHDAARMFPIVRDDFRWSETTLAFADEIWRVNNAA